MSIENIQVEENSGSNSGLLWGTSNLNFETWAFSILASILVGLSGLFPLLVIPLESGHALKYGEPAKRLRLMLSFAVGSLLGDVFLHLLPELWADIDSDKLADHKRIGLWVISGLLAFMILEKLFGDETEFEHLNDTCDEVPEATSKLKTAASKSQIVSKIKCDHLNGSTKYTKKRKGNNNKINKSSTKLALSNNEPKEVRKYNSNSNSGPVTSEYEQNNIKVSGYLNLMANIVDNFTHGLAVAASFCISTKVGLITTLAILLHEIPHEVGDFAILLRSGFNRWKAAKAQFLTASGGVVGAITALTSESTKTAGDKAAWILPFTSGGFMYIALVTVVPDLLQEKHGWESLKQVGCVCFGVLSIVFVTLVFD